MSAGVPVPYRDRAERIKLAREALDRAEIALDGERGRYAAGERVAFLARESCDRSLEHAAAILRGER